MSELNDPDAVAEEYSSEHGLLGRREAYRYATGPDARALAVEAVLEVRPKRVLEVGCGPGEAAERIAGSGAEVVATDASERMVELTLARGLDAQVADVQELPFEDESFDCALAAWMLYHVPDVSRAVAELARVLRPGGRLVAVTNRSDHLHELHELLGAQSASAFDDESGPRLLEQHFARVEERDAGGWVDFPDRQAVQAYVDSTGTFFANELPGEFDGGLRVRRSPVIYVATR